MPQMSPMYWLIVVPLMCALALVLIASRPNSLPIKINSKSRSTASNKWNW